MKPRDARNALPPEGRFGSFGLSRQESRVPALAMEGLIDKQIAAEVGTSLGTVRAYWRRIRSRTGGTRSEALAIREAQDSFGALGERAKGLRRAFAERLPADRLARAYEAAFLASDVPFALLYDATGVVSWANPAFERLLEEEGGGLGGRPLADWIPAGNHPEPTVERVPIRPGGEARTATLAMSRGGSAVLALWIER